MSQGAVREKLYFPVLAALRGIAAELVVMRHTGMLFGSFLPRFPVSYLAVDIFFLLSGVVLEASYGHRLRGDMSRRRFIWIRWLRIYPLYILGSSISLAILLLTPWHTLSNGGFPSGVGDVHITWPLAMALLPSLNPTVVEFPFDHPAWSLFYELVVNVVYALVAGFLTDWLLGFIILGCGLWLLQGLLLFNTIHVVELGWMQPTLIPGLARAGWSFFVGVGLFRLYRRAPLAVLGHWPGVMGLAVLLAAFGLLVALVPKPAELPYYILCVGLLFPVLIYVALHVRAGRVHGKLFDFMGDVSYPVYTLHVPLFFLLCAGTPSGPVAFVARDAPWSGFVFLLVLTGGAYGAHRYFDQPVQRALRWVGSCPLRPGG